MNEELKPCPFCGGKAEIITWNTVGWAIVYGVMCLKCEVGIEGTFKNYTRAEAIEAWNKRVK